VGRKVVLAMVRVAPSMRSHLDFVEMPGNPMDNAATLTYGKWLEMEIILSAIGTTMTWYSNVVGMSNMANLMQQCLGCHLLPMPMQGTILRRRLRTSRKRNVRNLLLPLILPYLHPLHLRGLQRRNLLLQLRPGNTAICGSTTVNYLVLLYVRNDDI